MTGIVKVAAVIFGTILLAYIALITSVGLTTLLGGTATIPLLIAGHVIVISVFILVSIAAGSFALTARGWSRSLLRKLGRLRNGKNGIKLKCTPTTKPNTKGSQI